jgi:hypothetical protein
MFFLVTWKSAKVSVKSLVIAEKRGGWEKHHRILNC